MNLETKILNQYKNEVEGYGHIPYKPFVHHMCSERERFYKKFLGAKFGRLNDKTILEIGAGDGDNLFFFNRLGIFAQNIYANEMVPFRIEQLKNHFENVYAGNFLNLTIDKKFDIVFQSTVFSSVLEKNGKIEMANKMKQCLAPGGVVLWYDFTYDNPKNKAVKGVKKSEIRSLFSDAKKITFKRVTLAPPIGRLVGEGYGFFTKVFPILRTHLIAVIEY